MNLAVFDLPSVINYNHLPLRGCLVSAIEGTLGKDIVLEGVNWEGNCSGVLLDIYMQNKQRFPSDEEYSAIKAAFLKCLKAYFKRTEENFEVRPGVQTLFNALDKKKDWKYVIVSEYWNKDTNFILTSCGIYTKSKNIYAADDALSSKDLVNHICTGYKLNPEKDTLYLISEHIKRRDIRFARERICKIMPPQSKKARYDVYPKFSKVFPKV